MLPLIIFSILIMLPIYICLMACVHQLVVTVKPFLRELLNSFRKNLRACSSVMLWSSCSWVRMYSRSASACNSGIPVESIMASRLINRHPLFLRIR